MVMMMETGFLCLSILGQAGLHRQILAALLLVDYAQSNTIAFEDDRHRTALYYAIAAPFLKQTGSRSQHLDAFGIPVLEKLLSRMPIDGVGSGPSNWTDDEKNSLLHIASRTKR